MLQVFTKLTTPDSTLNRIQDNIVRSLNPVITQQLNSGNLLTSISLKTGNNLVPHKLGRNLTGWFVTRMRGVFVQVYDAQDSNKSPSLTLALNSSGACVVDLFVF